ncbi:hypothetical protein BCR42DRAFT_433718 [Absidia repens]|uniref:Uncharacterized protein n=1 Tax=Absidia repens TaxID=90262 RepID=A0A1X2IUB7_9FUNG|nr:hypothetical protein BCR42DRAFT_433718 [Absidia repens]
MYRTSQLDVLLHLHQSGNNDATKNRITYKNKTVTVNVKNEDMNTSRDSSPITSNYIFDQCLPILNLHSATSHTEYVSHLAHVYCLDELQFIQQQLSFLESSVKLQSKKRTQHQLASLNLEYCYISLTDEACQNLLSKSPIKNNDIIANGLDRYMTVFTTLEETSAILSDNNCVLVPKLMVFKITDRNSVTGYLYILDLQQPYSRVTNAYPLSANFNSLEIILDQLKGKQSEVGSLQANCVLDHLLIELLIGRQQGLLILDIDENPPDDDLLQELNAKILILEKHNQEMKHKIKEAKTTMEVIERQYQTQIKNMTKYIMSLEASLSTHGYQRPKMENSTSLSQEKLLSIESAPHSSHEKYQGSKKRKVLSEGETWKLDTPDLLMKPSTLALQKQKFEEINWNCKRQLDTVWNRQMNSENKLEAEINRLKAKQVHTFKARNQQLEVQDTATLNTNVEKYYHQLSEAKQTVNTQNNTIRHLNFVIEQITSASEQQKNLSQKEIISLKKEKKEMERQHRGRYDRLQHEFQQYVENQHYKMMGHQLKHEQKDERIQWLQNSNDRQRQVIQKQQADTLGYQQTIHDLNTEFSKPQATIQELEKDKALLLKQVAVLEKETSSHQTYITTLKEESQVADVNARTSKLLAEDLQSKLEKEKNWMNKQLDDMKKERLLILQWIELARLKWNQAFTGTTPATAATTSPCDDLPILITSFLGAICSSVGGDISVDYFDQMLFASGDSRGAVNTWGIATRK